MRIYIIESNQSCGHVHKKIVEARLQGLGIEVVTEHKDADLVVILYCRDTIDTIKLGPETFSGVPFVLIGHCRNHRRINGATHINASDKNLQGELQKAIDTDKKYPPSDILSEIIEA
jgi:hypothetical protein